MRSRSFIAVAVVLLLCLTGIGGVYAYDKAKAHTIAQGVRIGDVDVSGLSTGAAERRLHRELSRKLATPVVVTYRHRRFVLSARRARVRADIAASVSAALARSRDGSILTRASRYLRGASVGADIQPDVSYSHAVVDRFVRRIARAVDASPQEAHVTFASTGPSIQQGRTGIALQRDRLRRAVADAFVAQTGPFRIPARVTAVRPKTTTAELAARYPTIIVVDRAAFHLNLYKKLKLVHSYTVAVGQQGLETPAGLYHIYDKQVDPSWHVPNSAWAGSLAGKVIPPGPDDPIKARWMAVFDGAGIHGTDELYSLGAAASHGCIRMAIPDVIQLYDETPTGTPIYIA